MLLFQTSRRFCLWRLVNGRTFPSSCKPKSSCPLHSHRSHLRIHTCQHSASVNRQLSVPRRTNITSLISGQHFSGSSNVVSNTDHLTLPNWIRQFHRTYASAAKVASVRKTESLKPKVQGIQKDVSPLAAKRPVRKRKLKGDQTDTKVNTAVVKTQSI